MSDDREILRTLAKALGLFGQVNADGTRAKVTGSMVVAKVIAMRDELAALKQASITPVATVGTKREREEEEEEDAPASTKLVKTLKTAIESGAIRPESKLEAIRAMKDVPSRFAPLCKYTVFKDRHGINLTVVGFNSTKSSFSCRLRSSLACSTSRFCSARRRASCSRRARSRNRALFVATAAAISCSRCTMYGASSAHAASTFRR